MTDDIYVYYTKMPPGQHEWVAPCESGYTVYLDEECLCDECMRLKCYRHALHHIHNLDFERDCVSDIEYCCHKAI